MAIVLQTERLILREMGMGDYPFLREVLSHPEVMAFWPRPHTEEEARAWIERQMARYKVDGYGYWLAVRKSDGRPIGQVGLMKVKVGARFQTALGYIVHRPYWREGYALEASAACIFHAFEEFNKNRVIALVRPENGPSISLARKLGMALGETVDYGGYRHIVFAASRPA